MKRVQSIVVIAVMLGAGAIIWFKGFQTSQLPVLAAPSSQESTQQSAEQEVTPESKDGDVKTETEGEAKAEESSQEAKTVESEEPVAKSEDESAQEDDDKAADKDTDKDEETSSEEEPAEPEDPNNPMESLSLKDVEMKDLISKIGEWTGKVIIPVDDALKQKITVFAPEELPRKEALSLIYSALRTKGYVAEETDRIIYFKPIDQAKLGQVPTIPAEQSLATIENKEQIVQRFVKIEYSDADRMKEQLEPFVGEYGEIRSDVSTGTLLVVDTVSNLMRIELMVEMYDVPEAEQTQSEVFTLNNADPLEIVQTLRILMGDESASGRNNRGRYSRYSASNTGSAMFTGPSKQPVVLIPIAKYKWVIARACPADLKTISDWITRLDLEDDVKSEFETVTIQFADPEEVADQIQSALAQLPGSELMPSVVIQSMAQSRQVMIFGRADLRQMVRNMIAEVDIPTGDYERETFDLKYADPEQIVANIESLYGNQQSSSSYRTYNYNYNFGGSGRRRKDPDMVKAIAFSAQQQVTVIASAENLIKIAEQIKEWDQPLDVDKVKPQIIPLKNSDPVQMAELLTKLFTEEDGGDDDFWNWYWWGDSGDSKKKIVGPLYGQLTFEEVPGAKKILVISKIPEAYDVIRELIEDLDRQEMAEVPRVITIKYADPEVLAERLNALFNERGTPTYFRLSERGLSDYQMNSDQNRGNNNNNNNNNDNNNNSDQYQPWWSSGRDAVDQEPLSNIIGRVRFIPDSHSRSIMVLSPPEFYESIESMIAQLDVPGKQVMVKAVIMEVDHSDMTSLGLQLAADSASFGDLSENSLLALGNLTHLATHGSAALDTDSPIGAVGTGSILGGTADIYALIDFLHKKVNARILNQQSLWTKDNTEASFFKGDTVAFQTDMSVSDTGGRVTSGLERTPVGMTLRVRPSITPEERVDMEVNVMLSQLTNDTVNNQPVTSDMETTTNMIVKDGQTIMLGGILFQRDEEIIRKLPLLGDLPLIGQLFRHNYNNLANSELIIFITPYVMTEEGDMESEAVMAESLQKLEEVSTHLDQVTRAMMDPNES